MFSQQPQKAGPLRVEGEPHGCQKVVRTFSLGQLVRTRRVGENESDDGALLRYRPDQQLIGKAAIVEVIWPGGGQGSSCALVEVVPDQFGDLLVRAANVAEAALLDEAPFRLPFVPADGWRHEKGCDCTDCRLA